MSQNSPFFPKFIYILWENTPQIIAILLWITSSKKVDIDPFDSVLISFMEVWIFEFLTVLFHKVKWILTEKREIKGKSDIKIFEIKS